MSKKGIPNIDYTGQVFGAWTVKEYIGKSLWVCVCTCGKEKNKYIGNFLNGKTLSSCHDKHDIKIGDKYGTLIVLERSKDKEKEKKQKSSFWKVRCDCGNDYETSSNVLLSKPDITCRECPMTNAGLAKRGIPSPLIEDLTNQRFGRLTVIKRIGTAYTKPLWECVCDCTPPEPVIISQALTSGNTISCGCYRSEYLHNNYNDITGNQYGRLTVLGFSKERIRDCVSWDCQCICGNKLTLPTSALISGNTKSCGCIHDDILRSWTGKNHPNWKGNQSLKRYIRTCKMIEWKNESMTVCNYECVITGKKFDNIHHLYPFHKIVEETIELLNYITFYDDLNDYDENTLELITATFLELQSKYGLGVCLTKELHEEFHSIYGSANFTPEDFQEFYYLKTGNKFYTETEVV